MDEPTPDERFERVPWEHLMPAADPRRRWLGAAVAAAAVVGVAAFLLGSRGPTPPTAAAAPPPPVPTTTTLEDSTAPIPPLSEADLRVPAAVMDGGIASALEAHLAEMFSAPGVWVDQVGVERVDDGSFLATIVLLESRDGTWVRADPVGVRVVARSEGGRVVIDHLAPEPVPVVAVPVPAGELGDVPDPVRDALVAFLDPWPGAVVERIGSDAGRWWVEVALPVGGATVMTVLWPDLGVGLGSGG